MISNRPIGALLLWGVVWGVAFVTWTSSAAAGQDASLGPLIAGTQSYVSGTFVATDYAYDDQGPGVNEIPGGDAVYPEGLENAADLIQLQLRFVGEALEITALLETLVDAGVPLVGIGFDLDGDASTGASAFPAGDFAPSSPLGLEIFVRLAKSGSALLEFEAGQAGSEGKWKRRTRLESEVDVDANTLRTSISGEAFLAEDARARVVAAVGLGTRRHDWLKGKGPVFDLAFVGNESPEYAVGAHTGRGAWQDRKQSEILAGTLDPDEARLAVDWQLMQEGGTRLASATTPGMHTLLYHSKLELGEGIVRFPERPVKGSHHPYIRYYRGPYQPYVLWLPDRTPEPAPLVVFIHGTGSTHLAPMARTWFGPRRFNPEAAVVFPFGRGEATGYFGAAEQDIFDVIDDISSRMKIDDDRVVLTGWSSGGMATMRLGQLRPDRFAGLVPIIGQSRQLEWIEKVISGGEFFLPNALENLYNLPVRSVSGRLDESKVDAGPDRDELDLYAMGYEYRHWMLLRRGHEVVPELMNSALVEAISRPRVIDPARVVYTVEPYLAKSEAETGLELHYDSAYWVSGLRIRGESYERGDKGTVDVTSLARPDRERTSKRISEYGVSKQADLFGPNPFVFTEDRWVTHGLVLEPGSGAPVSNGLRAAFVDVGEVALDVARMGLRTDRALSLEIEGDGTTRVRLLGDWPAGVSLWRGEEKRPAPDRDAEGITLLEDFSGRHVWHLRP